MFKERTEKKYLGKTNWLAQGQLSWFDWLLAAVGLPCKAHEGFTVSMLWICAAAPRGMEELCCTVRLWWLPGSAGSQRKQQSILQTIMCQRWGACTHTYECIFFFFPGIYHASYDMPGISLPLSVYLLTVSLSPFSLSQHVISHHMTILLWALITSLLIAPSAFSSSSSTARSVAAVSVYDSARRYHRFSFRKQKWCAGAAISLVMNSSRSSCSEKENGGRMRCACLSGCVCVGGAICFEENSWHLGRWVSEIQTKTIFIHHKNKEEMLSSLVAPRSVRALVCSGPNLKSLSLRRGFPHITENSGVHPADLPPPQEYTHCRGGIKGTDGDQTPPFSPPSLFQPPTAEVGGGVVTKKWQG